MVGWGVLVGDGGPKELVGIVLHCSKEGLFSISSLQEESAITIHSSGLDGQRPALGGLEGQAHGLSLLLHVQLELLVLLQVVGNQVKVVGKQSCENFAFSELITTRVSVRLYEVNEGLENNKKDTGTVGVTLENSFQKPENVTDPVFG